MRQASYMRDAEDFWPASRRSLGTIDEEVTQCWTYLIVILVKAKIYSTHERASGLTTRPVSLEPNGFLPDGVESPLSIS